VNDILEALRFAAQNSLRTSILGAGHQVVGVQLVPNGVIIDTKTLTGINVDPDSQTALVQSGVTASDGVASVCYKQHSLCVVCRHAACHTMRI